MIETFDLPIAIIILPQFASSAAIAVLTKGEFAIEKAIFFETILLDVPLTVILINLEAPSPSLTICKAKSLNILIDNATGQLIARQDADDYSSKDRLSIQVAFLREHNLDACTSRSKVIGSGKARPGLSFYLPIKLTMRYKNPFIHGTLLIKKDALIEIEKYDENFYYAQDYKLFKDLIDKGYKVNSLNKFLYFLNTEDNISSIMKKEQNFYAKLVRNS